MTKEEKELKAGKGGNVPPVNQDDLEDELEGLGDGDDDVDTGAKPTTSTGKQAKGTKDNKISVDREMLAEILRDNETFKLQISQLQSNAVSTQPGNPMMVRNRKKETLIKLRRWNDQYVVGWVNKATRPGKFVWVTKETDPQTRETKEFIEIILRGDNGKESVLKLDYLDYLQNSEPVFVKLLRKIEEEEEVINQGRVFKKDFVENGYGMFETTVQVPVEVVIPHYKYVVELEEGGELEISDRFVG